MSRRHSSSASSGSSTRSAQSYSSRRTCDTNITTYSNQSFHSKTTKEQSAQIASEQYVSPRSSVETYASTIDLVDEDERRPSGPYPSRRYQCYKPDFSPATAGEFAAVYPSTRRLLIQHDETTDDGNMNIHVDTEVTTTRGHHKKLSLFHLRMKDLKERQFSIRRYGRDSGREVASCSKHYIKSAPSSRQSSRRSSQKSLLKSTEDWDQLSHQRADSGYDSAESDDEDEQQMLERLSLMTTPKDEIVSQPTDAIDIEFSNYAHVIMDRSKDATKKGHDFEYWGESYFWKREKQIDNGETIYCYDLIRNSDGKKMAVIMPDALSPQESKWEAKQGGWIPASSMRLLDNTVSSDVADVIMTTGLIALTDDSIRQNFRNIDQP